MVVEPSTQPTHGVSLPALRSTRGAAFLLAVYLSALMLLLLGGVSLQRTTTEVKASEISRNLQQAFWSAEAGLDQALTALRQDKPLPLGVRNAQLVAVANLSRSIGQAGSELYTSLGIPKSFADGTYGPFTTSSGTYMVRVQTNKIAVLNPDSMQLTRTFTVTGTSAGRQATVTSTVVTDDVPLSGILANGKVALGDTLLTGSIHTGAGTPGSVFINDDAQYARIMGDITVGPPDQVNPYTTLVGFAKSDGTWFAAPETTVGVGIYSALWPFWTPRKTVSGEIATVEMPRIKSLAFPTTDYPLSHVTQLNPLLSVVELGDYERREIKDGDLIDISGPPGVPDGKIVLDLKSLSLGYRAQLTTNAPTDVYLHDIQLPEGIGPPVESAGSAYLGYGSVLVAVDPAKESAGQPSVYKDGIRLLVTDGVNPGYVQVDQPWAFFGSIWAPNSMIFIEPNDKWVKQLKEMFTLADLNNFDWQKFYDKNYDPTIPGKTKGLVNQYVVADTVVSGQTGCASLFVEAATANTKANNASATLTGWHNTQDRVTAP